MFQLFRFALILLCGLVVSSCATSRFSTDAVRVVPEDFFGAAHAGKRLSPKEYRLLDDLGIVWMRNTFQWSGTQARSKQWDFSRWDRYVDSGKAAGKKILGVLAYDTGWIYGEDKARRNIIEEKIPYFLQYVEGMVRRYDGRIDAFEIWNEPNWLFWKGTEEDFILLTKAAAKKIKEINPEITVVAGSFLRVPEGLLRKMFESGAMENVDAVSFHPYAVNPEGVIDLYDKLKALLDEYRFPGDIWITEVGFPTGGLYVTSVSDAKFPLYVIKTLAGLSARGARAVFWYELFDKFPEGQAPSILNSELYFGLAYPDYKLKPGARAYALFAKNVSGAVYRPDLIRSGAGVAAGVESFLYRRADGGSCLILWARNLPVKVSLRLPGEDHRISDIGTGAGIPAGRSFDIPIDNTPVFLTWKQSEGEPGSVSIEKVRE